jgi:uncharacterized membrane protein YoaK (UPF0700 family)
LLGFTFATGLVDAASLLGPGRVFTANMTGNLVFLGFAAAGSGETSISMGLIALTAFLVGAVAGGWFALGSRVGRGLGVELVALGGAVAIAALLPRNAGAVLLTVGLLAVAMGMRNALIRSLAVPDLTTTVLTLTLTALAADSSLAGGANPRWIRRVSAVASLVAGAVLGAWAMRFGLPVVLAAAFACELASGVLLVRSRSEPAE